MPMGNRLEQNEPAIGWRRREANEAGYLAKTQAKHRVMTRRPEPV